MAYAVGRSLAGLHGSGPVSPRQRPIVLQYRSLRRRVGKSCKGLSRVLYEFPKARSALRFADQITPERIYMQLYVYTYSILFIFFLLTSFSQDYESYTPRLSLFVHYSETNASRKTLTFAEASPARSLNPVYFWPVV